MIKEKQQLRPIFVYLTMIAVILGVIGIIILAGNLSGRVIEEEEKYSLEEISQHNTKQDCWISYNEKVYDITLFLQVYPEDLSEKCGEDVELNEELEKGLEGYQIGILK